MKYNSGYIALTSAIIIIALVLVIVIALSLSALFSTSGIATSYYKETSLALSRGCAETALLKLVQDINYVGDEIITIGSNDCEIESITTNGSEKIIETEAEFERTESKLKIVIESSDLTIVSWEEE